MNTEKIKIKIKAIKTDIGYFCQLDYNGRYSGCGHNLEKYFFDGEKIQGTNNPSWGKIKNIPKIIEEDILQPNINHRYELIDKTIASEKFPLVLNRYEVAIYNSEDYCWQWVEKYAHLRSLYLEISDKQPPIRANVEFEFNICLEMDNIKEYGGFSYPVQRSRWENDGFIPLTDKDVQYEEIDTIIFPDIVLPARTSKLTSHQTYKIIRKHIQDNINPKYAKISSDYDFCMTVEKKIPLSEKTPYQVDVNWWKNKKRPKYETRYNSDRSIKIFEMTHTGEGGNYKGYTPIDGFSGKNVKELKENIDSFLTNLMNKINEPLVDCPNCKGLGVLLENK